MLTMSEERVYYPSDPKLRELAILADAEEQLREVDSLMWRIDDEKKTALLQEIFGDEVVGDPYAIEDYNDAKETVDKAALLRSECEEAEAEAEQLREKIKSLEWVIRDIRFVLNGKRKGSKLDAIAKILAK